MGVSTLWFNGQFWLVTYEVIDDDGVRASQRVLGSEPTGPELYAFLDRAGAELIDEALRSPVVVTERRPRLPHPKQAARAAARESVGPSTASHEAIRLAYEERKEAKKSDRRRRDAEQREEIRLKRRKRARDRHRGH